MCETEVGGGEVDIGALEGGEFGKEPELFRMFRWFALSALDSRPGSGTLSSSFSSPSVLSPESTVHSPSSAEPRLFVLPLS